MKGHTTRFPVAMSFAAMLALSTVLGAAAQTASAPDTITAATAEHAPAQPVQQASVDSGEHLVPNRSNQVTVEFGSPSRFNKTIDYGE